MAHEHGEYAHATVLPDAAETVLGKYGGDLNA